MHLEYPTQVQATIPTRLLSIAALGVVVVLTVYALRFFISGPELSDVGPSYRVVTDSRYELTFSVANTQRIAINGQEVIAQSGGRVEHMLYLAPGMNITQIDAYDPYNNHKRVHLYITYPQYTSIPD